MLREVWILVFEACDRHSRDRASVVQVNETPRPSPESSEAATFTYLKPSEDLSPFIAFHYVIGVGDAPFDANLCALLGQFQVALRGSAAFHLSHGRRVAPRCALIGPTDRAVRMEATPGFVGVGSGLTPTGWSLAPGVSSPSNGLTEVATSATCPDVAGADGPGRGDDRRAWKASCGPRRRRPPSTRESRRSIIGW